MCISKFTKEHQDKLYLVFRILVGLMFFAHGAQKLFGWFGGQPQAIASLMGVAGVIEVVGGMLIALGLFTRPAALLSAAQMIVAFVKVHLPMGLIPIMNKGELSLLYFAAFLILLVYGNGIWSLEKTLFGKERW